MAYCGESIAVKNERAAQVAVSLKCRSWTCPDCQSMRKRQLIAQGTGGCPNLFLTLTHRASDKYTPNEAAKRLSWAWRLCRLRLMRKHKLKHLPFLAVIERHKSGWPHLHILIRSKFLPWAEISAIMKELIDSPRVRIEKISSQSQMAGYCVKYCSKATEKFETAKRYWQSRDYDLRDPWDVDEDCEPGEGWDRIRSTIRRFAENWESIGGVVQWVSADKCLCHHIPGFHQGP